MAVPSGCCKHGVHHLAHRLRGQIDVVIGAARRAGARVQQPQVVVDLGDRADGGARIVRGRFLLDGDGRRQALDGVDVRLFHHRQELAGVGRQRFDVAPLALGIDGVEGQRGLAGAGQAGQDDQPIARQVEIDVLAGCGSGRPGCGYFACNRLLYAPASSAGRGTRRLDGRRGAARISARVTRVNGRLIGRRLRVYNM